MKVGMPRFYEHLHDIRSARHTVTLARQNSSANPGCSRRSTLVTCACGLFASQICRLHDPLNSVSCALAIGQPTVKGQCRLLACRDDEVRLADELADASLSAFVETVPQRSARTGMLVMARLRKRDTAELDVDEAYL